MRNYSPGAGTPPITLTRENFFFLLHGPNAKVGSGGENAANYKNAEFDQLFERMRNMD